MNSEKQIEEMAKVICAPTANKGNCEKCGFKKHCSKFDDATDLYNAGYRKSSEVAEDIIRILRAAGINEHRYPVIAEIKKKYTEGNNEE